MAIKLMSHQQAWCDMILLKMPEELARHGWPLFGEPGTGKTYPLCEVATELTNLHGGHALYVVPTRGVWNWAYEHSRMRPDIPNVQRLVIHGTAAERAQQMRYFEVFRHTSNLHVFVGYDALRIHQQWFQSLEDITVLVSDETHKAKNPNAQRTRALKSVNARFRFAATGTAVTNYPNDLWSLLHYLDPGAEFTRIVRGKPPVPGSKCVHAKGYRRYYKNIGCNYCPYWSSEQWVVGAPAADCCKHRAAKKGTQDRQVRYRYASPTWGNYNDFEKRYCRIRLRGRYKKILGGQNMGELNRRLKDFGMTRWLVDDVLELLPLVFQHVRITPTQAETRNYKAVSNGIISVLESAEEQKVGYFQRLNPLTILTYLRQCTTLTPTAFAALRGGLLDEILECTSPLATGDVSSKEEWLLDHLEGTNGAKYLVYTHWIGPLDHLYHTLRKAGYGTERIYGRHNKSPRDALRLMKEFAENPKLQILIGNESMGELLNFQAARYVVFFHLPWVPKDVIQFIGRARRFGQKRTVIAYFLSQRGTIDEAMAETCLSKQADSDAIFDPEFTGRSGMFNIQSARGLIDLIRRST